MEEDSMDTEYASLLEVELPVSPSVASFVEKTNTSKEILVLVAATRYTRVPSPLSTRHPEANLFRHQQSYISSRDSLR